MYYCQLQQILLATSVNVVLMPDDGSQDRNMWHLLMKLIKFVMVDINRYVALDMLYHSGMNLIKITIDILFQSQHNSYRICGGQSGDGIGFV